MRFNNRTSTQFLIVSPTLDGWEFRITSNEGYETIHLDNKQVWQIAELIHDCEPLRRELELVALSRQAIQRVKGNE